MTGTGMKVCQPERTLGVFVEVKVLAAKKIQQQRKHSSLKIGLK